MGLEAAIFLQGMIAAPIVIPIMLGIFYALSYFGLWILNALLKWGLTHSRRVMFAILATLLFFLYFVWALETGPQYN